MRCSSKKVGCSGGWEPEFSGVWDAISLIPDGLAGICVE